MILLIVIVHCYSSASVNAFVKKAIMEKTTTKTRIYFFFSSLGRQIITVKKKKMFQNKGNRKTNKKNKMQAYFVWWKYRRCSGLTAFILLLCQTDMCWENRLLLQLASVFWQHRLNMLLCAGLLYQTAVCVS